MADLNGIHTLRAILHISAMQHYANTVTSVCVASEGSLTTAITTTGTS
jgi:hypothetical protein